MEMDNIAGTLPECSSSGSKRQRADTSPADTDEPKLKMGSQDLNPTLQQSSGQGQVTVKVQDDSQMDSAATCSTVLAVVVPVDSKNHQRPVELPAAENVEKDPLIIPEMLSIILSYIETRDDIRSCRLVSKLWNQIITPNFRLRIILELNTEMKMTKFLEDMKETADYPFARFMILPSTIAMDSIKQFCTLYGPWIRELIIDPESAEEEDTYLDPDLLHKIIHMLNNTPELEDLDIQEIDEKQGQLYPYREGLKNFNNSRKLKVLWMDVSDNTRFEFYEEILLRAATSVYNLSLEKTKGVPPSQALILGGLTNRMLKRLELVAIPYAYLANFGTLPELEEVDLEHMPVFDAAVGKILQDFLTAQATTLVSLRLGVDVKFLEPFLEAQLLDFPVLSKLTFLELAEPHLFKPISPAHVPVLKHIRVAADVLRDRIQGQVLFGTVAMVTLYGQRRGTILSVLPLIKSSFPNINVLKFTTDEPKQLTWVFKHLHQLEGLEVTCDCNTLNPWDFNPVLMGMDAAVGKWIFKSFLADKYGAAEIQEAAKPFLSAKANKYSLRHMNRLKRLKIEVEKELELVLTDECVFISIMQMNPFLEHLTLENLEISSRSFSEIDSCIKRIDLNF